MRHAIVALGTLATVALAAPAGAEEALGPKLPPDLRALLVKEMQAIDGAAERIRHALVRADLSTVAREAQAIHDSFILKQEMTPEQRQALLETAPKAFVGMDRAFHGTAAKVAEDARAGDLGKTAATFGGMLGECAACHVTYAPDRFPMTSGAQAQAGD